jgi:glucosamine--fructose-6-phosphate aminotransferase (isomerizing)
VKGRLKQLAEKTDGGRTVPGSCGIGHTRWATHGEPSKENAHPHCSDDQSIIVVHNGIIENYLELKEKLTKNGYSFYSQTDTEVVTKLLDYYHKKCQGNMLEAIAKVMLRVRGSYALGIMAKEEPGVIYTARKDSPLIIGQNKRGTFIASDVPAILKYTRQVYYIGNLEIARLTKDEVHFYNIEKEEIQKDPVEIKWDAEAAEKGGFEHFMMKEIHEQPKAVQDTIGSYLKDGAIDLSSVGLSEEQIKGISRIYIVACGSAYHVGVAAKYVIEDLAKIPVEVDLASEFRYRNPLLEKDSLVVIISQSGETADSLAALREAKRRGIRTLAIVNVIGSSIPREADNVFYTMAGPEIAVATTKAYSTQLIAAYLLAIQFAMVRGTIDEKYYGELIAELQTLPEKIKKILDDKERIQWFASKFSNVHDIFFIGRGLDYAISLEGSLKMKEISYIHSEAYAAGELKHGTISLVEEGVLVISVLTQKDLFEKTLSNMVEVKSRGAYLMGLTNYGNYSIEDTADFTVYVPKTDPHFTTSLAIIPLQLMGYYVSCAKGLDVDKPRNLAKSVTVE